MNKYHSEKRFSRFLIWVLIVTQCISLTLIMGILSHFLIRTVTHEYHLKIQSQQYDISMLLHDRFDELKASLKELSLNNSIKISLMLGVHSQLIDLLNNLYPKQNGATYLVQNQDSEILSPDRLPSWTGLKARLKEMSSKEEIRTDYFVLNHDHHFLTLISIPILRQNERLGTGYIIYDISADSRLWERIKASTSGRLAIVDNGQLIDLQSFSSIPQADALILSHDTSRHPNQFGYGMSFIPIKDWSRLYFASPTKPLRDKKLSLLYTLAFLCISVFALALVASFLIGRRMSRPLEKLADQSLEIAKNPDLRFKETTIDYLEFQKLASGFNVILSKLSQAQAKLKKQTRMELDASEKRYRRTVEAAPDAFVISDLENGSYLEINQAFCNICGYSREEVLGKSPSDFGLLVRPADRCDMIRTVIEKGEANQVELQLRTRNGALIDTLVFARLIQFEKKNCLLEIMTDITTRKKTDQALKESEHTLMTILDSVKATILAADLQTYEILFMNRHMKEVFGEFEGKICYQVFRNQSATCSHCTNPQLIDPTDDPDKVIVWEGKNPITNRWYINYDRAIRWIDGRRVKFQVAMDITKVKELEAERLQTEARLQQIQKMEAIGMLAGGVAHDLNNILSGIVSYPDLLLLRLPEDSPLTEPIRTIRDTGIKAAAIVQDLLTLARRGVVLNEVINLNDVINEYLKSPEFKRLRGFHPNVEIDIRLDPDLLPIMGSPVHLSKTIMNLVTNAAEAIPDIGTIAITTECRYIERPIGRYEEIQAGDYVILTLSDTGTGISEQDQERIFEPFYTRKIMGRSGTGLGMAVVWGTVKDHNGYIDLQSADGKGTTFNLYFPACRETSGSCISEESNLLPRGNGEKVLVIDDVTEQRLIASQLLEDLGYRVVAVSSGEQAVEYLGQHTAEILLLDMIMEPGMDGLDTYREIARLHPGQKAVIASGFSETQRVRETQSLGAGTYIKKPYTIKDLATAIHLELSKPNRPPN